MSELVSEYELSKSYVEQYTQDFPELDNLVDAISLQKDPKAPFVGDTTLAGLVRSIPRSSLKQLPVLAAVVNGTKNSIHALICTFLLKKTAFNEDTFGKGLLSTLQIGAQQALSHGYAPFLVSTGSMYNDFGTRMRLLHYSDTSPEPGIEDANESAYHYVTAHLTPSRVRKILRMARNNPDTAWNIPVLERVLQTPARSKTYSIYESDARRNNGGEDMGPTYQFVTRYETGPGAKIITFCPEVTEAPLRVMESKSKWGYPRVHYLVIDPAALTPFGISRVRLASPNQNLMNIYYQNIASMLMLNSKPPILKRGTFLKPVSLKQGAVWETLDPQAKAELVTLDNGSLGQFVEMAQQFAGQIQNIMGTPTGTVSGGNNQFGFSKTAPGVKMQQEIMDDATNQITKILENFLRQYALVALDTLLSEQSGEDIIIVDDETKNAINEIGRQQFVPEIDPLTGMPTQYVPIIGDDNKYGMVWERFYEAIEEWSVEVDVSLSPDELKEQTESNMQDMMVALSQNADRIPGAAQKATEITDMLLKDKMPMLKSIRDTQVPMAPSANPAAPAQNEPSLTAQQ